MVIKLPDNLEKVGSKAFYYCHALSEQGYDDDTVHYRCDLVRGGKRYLIRNEGNNDGIAYPTGLWSLILYRAMNEMEYPTNEIFYSFNYDDYGKEEEADVGYTDSLERQRASVVYHLMINGIAMECR